MKLVIKSQKNRQRTHTHILNFTFDNPRVMNGMNKNKNFVHLTVNWKHTANAENYNDFGDCCRLFHLPCIFLTLNHSYFQSRWYLLPYVRQMRHFVTRSKYVNTYSSIRLWCGIWSFVAYNFIRSLFAYHINVDGKLPCNEQKKNSTYMQLDRLLLQYCIAFVMRPDIESYCATNFQNSSQNAKAKGKIDAHFHDKTNQFLTWQRTKK